ncbi:methylenetetrahydrofolate reductase [Geopsychrobacter electrodiphilus]|uniref:methylenetetrahydrofolate reductase n=1 Tax=Geopsychrobacter electrodiphilus TaxID=225196 RepID=UPI00035DB5E6|nr:methylenetetrahydrofolate reductase [Geopsychrobacter electrodiphilus]
MTEISLELVPRTAEALCKELALVKQHLPVIDRINIPDILRFDLRSWEGCRLAAENFSHTIPHLRAIDFDLSKPLPILNDLTGKGIEAVLVITGDPPQDMSRRSYRTSCIDFISRLKRDLPSLKIYAGIDPYRSGIKAEIDYVRTKIDAGADGFFTQPFFDLRLMDLYRDQLPEIEVWWGVSPVMSLNSQHYWENKNNAVFPPDFKPTLEWNRHFAIDALNFVRNGKGNIYFMPIRTDIQKYLGGLL